MGFTCILSTNTFLVGRYWVFKLYVTILLHNPYTIFTKVPFENIVEKGENAGNQHFLLFPQYFLSLSKSNFNDIASFILSSADALNLD